jgi:hypothetical protein
MKETRRNEASGVFGTERERVTLANGHIVPNINQLAKQNREIAIH